MNRFTALPLLLCLLAAGCATAPRGGIEHAVFIWLKRPGNAADRAALVRATRELEQSTGLVRSFRHGRPVPGERPVVDDTFDLALLMRFADRDALAEFENHPAHRQARKDVLQPLARKVIIYDIAWE